MPQVSRTLKISRVPEKKFHCVEVRWDRRPSHISGTFDPSCGICIIQDVSDTNYHYSTLKWKRLIWLTFSINNKEKNAASSKLTVAYGKFLKIVGDLLRRQVQNVFRDNDLYWLFSQNPFLLSYFQHLRIECDSKFLCIYWSSGLTLLPLIVCKNNLESTCTLKYYLTIMIKYSIHLSFCQITLVI